MRGLGGETDDGTRYSKGEQMRHGVGEGKTTGSSESFNVLPQAGGYSWDGIRADSDDM